ncbi:MAG: hypothetical protein MR890_06610 [Akkermansia muciniphila]|nr:hypothetical protein [Akkermansia muciniphila]
MKFATEEFNLPPLLVLNDPRVTDPSPLSVLSAFVLSSTASELRVPFIKKFPGFQPKLSIFVVREAPSATIISLPVPEGVEMVFRVTFPAILSFLPTIEKLISSLPPPSRRTNEESTVKTPEPARFLIMVPSESDAEVIASFSAIVYVYPRGAVVYFKSGSLTNVVVDVVADSPSPVVISSVTVTPEPVMETFTVLPARADEPVTRDANELPDALRTASNFPSPAAATPIIGLPP